MLDIAFVLDLLFYSISLLINILGECPCVATEHKLFVKMLAYNDYSKKNNT